LDNLKQSDTGHYVCYGENELGRNHDYVYVEVSPRSGDEENNDAETQTTTTTQSPDGPKPFVSIQSLTNGKPIKPDEELRVVCLISDDSQAMFMRKDGQQQDNVKTETHNDNGAQRLELVFTPFKEENVGEYQCLARNANGQVSKDAKIGKEGDNYYTFETESLEDGALPGNPHAEVTVNGSPEQGSTVDLNCQLKDDNGVEVKYYTWSRYPSLPSNSQANENQLRITDFNDEDNNGWYTCRATTDDTDYHKSALVASNDYLLGENPYFKFTKDPNNGDQVIVKCRPGINLILFFQ
jgi:hypothetical protein